MQPYGLTFDHLGLAVRQPQKATHFLRGLGYSVGETVYDPLQKVNLIWCESQTMPAVELIYANTDETSSPVDNILRDASAMIYHQCYRSADTQASIQAMKEDSVRVFCVSDKKPAILFQDRPVSFYMVDGFGLIEIIECGNDAQLN